MSSNTLDALGRAVLEAVEGRRVAAETLESELDADGAAVEDRLAQLVDNGLIREVSGDAETEAGSGGDGYELTENGRRLLNATPVGAHDDRIDTPANVDRAIADFDLRPDEEAAVRNAFSFLRYWGEATTAEIIDAAYSEAPAGRETADRWWDDCVRERLAALPDVRAVPDEPVAGTERWAYDGVATVESADDRDGRAIGEQEGDAPSIGSARHAIETADPPERARRVIRAAFAVLFDRRTIEADDLRDAVDAEYLENDVPIEDPATWLADRLAEIPDVDCERDADGTPVLVRDPHSADEP